MQNPAFWCILTSKTIHQCSRKEKDSLQRSSSGHLKLEPKTWGIEAHPFLATKLLGDISLRPPESPPIIKVTDTTPDK
jgi:hypothetical protein